MKIWEFELIRSGYENVIMTWTACELTFKEKDDDARALVLNGGQKYQEMGVREKLQCV